MEGDGGGSGGVLDGHTQSLQLLQCEKLSFAIESQI